ncbi:MAG: hypothetical protein K0Q66_753 [Chitinophagaceae bacterium]|jgi:hypothetical protein|nr:hypothetical protein [Chitinophagaceae bacterium]
MRSLLLFILLATTLYSNAQDEAQFPDVRSKKDAFSRVQQKDIRSDISCFSMGGLDESAGKQPLRSLTMTGVGSDSIAFEGNGIQVKIKAGPFDASKHKLGYYTNAETNKKYLVRIDNKPFFGDYGHVPDTKIQSVQVLWGGDTVAIPYEAYGDLFNPIFSYNENGVEKYINNVYLSADGNRAYIYMLKREEGGSYEVTWVIENKQYIRRVVDFGFLKN